MKYFNYLLLIILFSCGTQTDYEYRCAIEGNDCEYTDKEAEPTQGPKGDAGIRGPRGFSGENAESCTVTAVENGALIKCPDGDGVVVLNGSDGEAGTNAEPAAYSFTEAINPCGVESGFEEILFRTASGEIVAHYSQGQKQFLTFLSPGAYKTTDGHKCAFTVTNELDVEW